MEGLGGSFARGAGGGDELRIEALAPVEGQAGGFRRICFPASLVSYLVEFSKDVSGIVLQGGVTIPVALGFDELKKQVYEPDFRTGHSIDLTLVTGARVGEVERVRLSKTFNPVSEKSAETMEKDLRIRLFVHFKPNDREFHCVEVKFSQIQHFEPSFHRMNAETFVKLKEPVADRTEFWLQMPMADFAAWIAHGKQNDRELIDITEGTRPKRASSYNMN